MNVIQAKLYLRSTFCISKITENYTGDRSTEIMSNSISTLLDYCEELEMKLQKIEVK